MIIYQTQEWKGVGKQSYYWNEYRQEGNRVEKYKCHRVKSFDSDGSYWANEERLLDSWDIDDPNMPDWLHKYITK